MSASQRAGKIIYYHREFLINQLNGNNKSCIIINYKIQIQNYERSKYSAIRLNYCKWDGSQIPEQTGDLPIPGQRVQDILR